MDEDLRARIDAVKRKLPRGTGRGPYVECRTLRGERPTTLDALREYVRVAEYSRLVDGDYAKGGYRAGEMRHARR